MASIQIVPRYKLLLTYDIRPDAGDAYFQYVLGEFVPTLQNMGLYMLYAWHTAYGDYPVRQIEFVSENLQTVQEIFSSERWSSMETRLQEYTTGYERKLVRYRSGFQF